jgi:hypothetical protein
MYDHMKPDTNLVIGNYEPMRRGNQHNWQLYSVTACPFRSRDLAIHSLGREAEKADRSECRVSCWNQA